MIRKSLVNFSKAFAVCLSLMLSIAPQAQADPSFLPTTFAADVAIVFADGVAVSKSWTRQLLDVLLKATPTGSTGTPLLADVLARKSMSVSDFGAVADAYVSYRGQPQIPGGNNYLNVTSGNANVVSAKAVFSVGNVGKSISIAGASASGNGVLGTTIASYIDSTHVVLATTPTASNATADFSYGTDNASAVQAAVTWAQGSPLTRCIIVPLGLFGVGSTISISSPVCINGYQLGGLNANSNTFGVAQAVSGFAWVGGQGGAIMGASAPSQGSSINGLHLEGLAFVSNNLADVGLEISGVAAPTIHKIYEYEARLAGIFVNASVQSLLAGLGGISFGDYDGISASQLLSSGLAISESVNAQTASFTGSISGSTLTVSALSAGSIPIGSIPQGAGITGYVVVLSQLSGTPGGVGTYGLNASLTVGSEAMTSFLLTNPYLSHWNNVDIYQSTGTGILLSGTDNEVFNNVRILWNGSGTPYSVDIEPADTFPAQSNIFSHLSVGRPPNDQGLYNHFDYLDSSNATVNPTGGAILHYTDTIGNQVGVHTQAFTPEITSAAFCDAAAKQVYYPNFSNPYAIDVFGSTLFVCSAGDVKIVSNKGTANTTNGFPTTGGYQLTPVLTSALPTCNSAAKGTIHAVTDASAPTYNGALTGGGAVGVPVYCDGTAWKTH